MIALLAALALFGGDPNPPPGPETCAFLPIDNPCHALYDPPPPPPEDCDPDHPWNLCGPLDAKSARR